MAVGTRAAMLDLPAGLHLRHRRRPHSTTSLFFSEFGTTAAICCIQVKQYFSNQPQGSGEMNIITDFFLKK